MTSARWSGLVALLALVLLPAAGAQAAECPPGSPTPVFTINGKQEPVYTTHDLTARVKLSGGADYTVESFDVTGMRRIADPSGDDPRPDEIHGIADSPGTLTATAALTYYDLSCTVTGTANFEVRQATAPIVSRLRKPPVFKGHPPWLWDSRYWFWVKPGPTGDVSPITVEARAIKRARIPGPSVPAKRFTMPMRPSDAPEGLPRLEHHGNCDQDELVCTHRVRSWADGAQVYVRALGGRDVPAAVKVQVQLPSGIPTLRNTLRKTPIGLDVKFLQSGATIARLRMAGRCDPRGQFFQCRYKKLSTAL